MDLNLRKNWWVATSKKPDAVVFLGDMMDGGRFDMSEEEYVPEYCSFHRCTLLTTGRSPAGMKNITLDLRAYSS